MAKLSAAAYQFGVHEALREVGLIPATSTKVASRLRQWVADKSRRVLFHDKDTSRAALEALRPLLAKSTLEPVEYQTPEALKKIIQELKRSAQNANKSPEALLMKKLVPPAVPNPYLAQMLGVAVHDQPGQFVRWGEFSRLASEPGAVKDEIRRRLQQYRQRPKLP